MTTKKDSSASEKQPPDLTADLTANPTADLTPPSNPIIVIGVPENVQPVFMRVPPEKFSYLVDRFEFKAGDNVVSRDWLDGHADHSDWLYGLQTGILVVSQ